MNNWGTGMSDSITQVVLKQAFAGGWYCDVGHASTGIYASPRDAAEAGNRLGTNLYGSTIRKINVEGIRG